MTANKFISGTQFPQMNLQQVGGGSLEIGTTQGGHDCRLVVAYRGKHCHLCSKYLKKLEGLKQDFYYLGVYIVAVSGDSE